MKKHFDEHGREQHFDEGSNLHFFMSLIVFAAILFSVAALALNHFGFWAWLDNAGLYVVVFFACENMRPYSVLCVFIQLNKKLHKWNLQI